MKKWSILVFFLVAVQTVAETSSPLLAKSLDSPGASAKEVIQTKLLEPLQEKEQSRSRFSRVSFPPRARRIRILGNATQVDSKGRPFLPFAIDENRSRSAALNADKDNETAWSKDIITGCIYPETGDILIKREEAYYASSMLLGVQTPIAPAYVCHTR